MRLRRFSNFVRRSYFSTSRFVYCIWGHWWRAAAPPVIKHRLDLCDVMCSRRLAGRQKFGEKFWECVRPKRRRFPALFVQRVGGQNAARQVSRNQSGPVGSPERPGNKARGRLAVHATLPQKLSGGTLARPPPWRDVTLVGWEGSLPRGLKNKTTTKKNKTKSWAKFGEWVSCWC